MWSGLPAGMRNLDMWIDDFSRDSHPSREIDVWETAAAVFSELTQEKRLAKKYHRILYNLLLNWILGRTKEEMIQQGLRLPHSIALQAFTAMKSYAPRLKDTHLTSRDEREKNLPSAADPVWDIEAFQGDVTEISDALIDELARRHLRKNTS
jgi:hypothetical protein